MQQGDMGCGNTTRRKLLGATGTALAAGVAGCLGSGGESNDSGGGGGTTGNDSSGGGSSGTFSTEATVTHWPILMYSPPYQAALVASTRWSPSTCAVARYCTDEGERG